MVKANGCTVIALTGNPASTLAKCSDLVINTGISREACPLGLAPTTSTTALLAVGDALAVVLTDRRRFNSADFKRYHPGGNLGQRLALQVRDLMFAGEALPRIGPDAPMPEVLKIIDCGGLGAVVVTDHQEQ